MYIHSDSDDSYISLHDCRAEKISFEDGVLSFYFPDGFWIAQQHPENKSENAVRTAASQAGFSITNNDTDEIQIYIYRRKSKRKAIREQWTVEDFINAVSEGRFSLEFISRYKSYRSTLFECWVWFKKKPYHAECEIILGNENAVHCWNELRYDHTW